MSIVAITVTPPGGSASDITNACMFAACSFEQAMNGAPGTFDIKVRDPNRTLSFSTGSEIKLTIDGVTMFGGYITQVGMTSLAPAADTSDLSHYTLRVWHLMGVDYNIVFDRRYVRDSSNYLNLDIQVASASDAVVLASMINNYADMADFSTSGITAVATIPSVTFVTLFAAKTIRYEFEYLLPFAGAVYYIDGDKVVHWKAYDNVEKRWGFSDTPNNNPITVSPASYQGALYGFSEVEGVEDGTYLANDALIWGGSQFAGSGETVFARYQDAVGSLTSTANTYIEYGTVTGGSSIDTHGRWQHAEAHFGESMFSSLDGVKAVAAAIISGPPGTDATGQQKGLKYPQWQFTFTWNSTHVPLLSGVPDHIRAGDLVTINLAVFGVTKLLPVRSIRTTFPDALINPNTGDRVVQFQATFGLQLSDSFTLWRYIAQNQNRITVQSTAVVSSSSTSTAYGASYAGVPTPAPNGSATVFTVVLSGSTPVGYIAGTLQVFLNGLIQRPGVDFNETTPASGTFTMTSAPLSTDNIIVECLTLGA